MSAMRTWVYVALVGLVSLLGLVAALMASRPVSPLWLLGVVLGIADAAVIAWGLLRILATIDDYEREQLRNWRRFGGRAS